jgi:hypothetical protein
MTDQQSPLVKIRKVTTDWLHDPTRWGHNHQSIAEAKQYQKWKNGKICGPKHKRARLTENELLPAFDQGPASRDVLAKRLGTSVHRVKHLLEGRDQIAAHTRSGKGSPMIYYRHGQEPTAEQLARAKAEHLDLIKR